jgi:molecular chaperone HscB
MAKPNHFVLLGIPAHYDLDPQTMERNYLERSRAVHPDFHQLSSSTEQEVSLQLTASLNDAYAVLKDPFKRAEYLLGLLGGPPASEHKQMSAEFLEEMLELRMAIEEVRTEGDQVGIDRMEQQLTQREEALFARVCREFEKVENTDEKKPGLIRIREHLNSAKYIQGLLRDLRAD